MEGRSRPSQEQVGRWMDRFMSGLDDRSIVLRRENRARIIHALIDGMERGEFRSAKYTFDQGMTRDQKVERMLEWWNDWRFHLSFAARNPDTVNELLGGSLDPDTMKVLYDARSAGIPFFVNPYYLSLLNVVNHRFAIGSDLAIRYYILYSPDLVNEFGHITAWEKEDQVKPGEPNCAGWLLPSDESVHRRYPEVAIMIPETTGRACGGLCSVCQRMYDFQRGHLNFNLEKLHPNETWKDRLQRYVDYFENDSQLRDILITGGDAFMSTDVALRQILWAVLSMIERKRAANEARPDGQKYAELTRVRLGSRLPVYLPQRVTPELTALLAEFKERASLMGVRQFVIQTHFESSFEVTPQARKAVQMLLGAGWVVTNQLVFTAAASRRGHTAKLRQVLNEIGVLPYYTFSVKGFMENRSHFATNARAVQEQLEEKVFGLIPPEEDAAVLGIREDPPSIPGKIEAIRRRAGLLFLATDRNVVNLPGVGKSLTFRVIGITRGGRRILEFDHDTSRNHSPIIGKMGKVIIIESKSIAGYLDQMDTYGEDVAEYEGLFGYSLAVTETRSPLFEYPEYNYKITSEYTNLDIGEDVRKMAL